MKIPCSSEEINNFLLWYTIEEAPNSCFVVNKRFCFKIRPVLMFNKSTRALLVTK